MAEGIQLHSNPHLCGKHPSTTRNVNSKRAPSLSAHVCRAIFCRRGPFLSLSVHDSNIMPLLNIYNSRVDGCLRDDKHNGY